MFNWSKKSNQASDRKIEIRQQIRAIFEKLESGSFIGEACNEEMLKKLTASIELAENLLGLMKENPDIQAPSPLTRTYLASALDWRVRYYRQKMVSLTGYSFHMVRELADEVKSRQPQAKAYLERMLVDLNRLLSDEMKADVGLRELKLEWRCMCFRALSLHSDAIEDAKQIVAQDVENYQAYILLSNCYFDYRNYPEAISAATKAIEHSIDDLQKYQTYSHRTRLYQQVGNQVEYEKDSIQAASFRVGATEIVKISTGG
jgi:tetratricopeptide (TPR) repeat protein